MLMEFQSFEMPVVKQSIKDDAGSGYSTDISSNDFWDSNQNTEFNYFRSK